MKEYRKPVTRTLGPMIEPLHYHSREAKRQWFGDFCEWLRQETIRRIQLLNPDRYCRYCGGPLPHTLAYCLKRGQGLNPTLRPVMLTERGLTGLPDPIDPLDYTRRTRRR